MKISQKHQQTLFKNLPFIGLVTVLGAIFFTTFAVQYSAFERRSKAQIAPSPTPEALCSGLEGGLANSGVDSGKSGSVNAGGITSSDRCVAGTTVSGDQIIDTYCTDSGSKAEKTAFCQDLGYGPTCQTTNGQGFCNPGPIAVTPVPSDYPLPQGQAAPGIFAVSVIPSADLTSAEVTTAFCKDNLVDLTRYRVRITVDGDMVGSPQIAVLSGDAFLAMPCAEKSVNISLQSFWKANICYQTRLNVKAVSEEENATSGIYQTVAQYSQPVLIDPPTSCLSPSPTLTPVTTGASCSYYAVANVRLGSSGGPATNNLFQIQATFLNHNPRTLPPHDIPASGYVESNPQNGICATQGTTSDPCIADVKLLPNSNYEIIGTYCTNTGNGGTPANCGTATDTLGHFNVSCGAHYDYGWVVQPKGTPTPTVSQNPTVTPTTAVGGPVPSPTPFGTTITPSPTGSQTPSPTSTATVTQPADSPFPTFPIPDSIIPTLVQAADFDHTGKVSILDYTNFVPHYGSSCSTARYDARFDICSSIPPGGNFNQSIGVKDCKINAVDLSCILTVL